MDAPPAQNSPQHILNVLDDDCIEEIMRRLTNLNDLINAAEVCQRFQNAAKICFKKFQSRHQKIVIGSQYFGYDRNWIVPFARADNFLYIFGSQLLCVCVNATLNEAHNVWIVKLIAEFAGKSLKELVLQNCDIDFIQMKFSVLERLIIYNTMPHNLHICSQLKFLQITLQCPFSHRGDLTNQGSWYIQRIPTLKTVQFYGISDLTDAMFAEFLSLNPQLEELKMAFCEN